MSSFCLSHPNLLFSELCYWSLTSEAATLNCDILSKGETIGLVGHLGLDKNHMTGLFSFLSTAFVLLSSHSAVHECWRTSCHLFI